MATLLVHHIVIFVGLVFLLVGVEAENNVTEFKALKDFVFGKGGTRIYGSSVEGKILSMIELIESGSISADVQGEQTLKYLKSLTDDCKDEKVCNLDEDLQRAARSSKRDTGAPNLWNYLQLCQVRIEKRCQSEVQKRAQDKLSLLDEGTMKAVDTLAEQLDKEIKPRKFALFGDYLYNPDTYTDNENISHATVLRALKKLDPAGSKAMLKKRIHKKAKLAQFMDQIRLPCIKFLEHIDPSVRLITPNYYYPDVSRWHFYLYSCKKVTDDWNSIFKGACSNYASYLADPKPVRARFFSGYSGGDSSEGGGVSAGTIIWMSGG